jgi:hypothetical protein
MPGVRKNHRLTDRVHRVCPSCSCAVEVVRACELCARRFRTRNVRGNNRRRYCSYYCQQRAYYLRVTSKKRRRAA